MRINIVTPYEENCGIAIFSKNLVGGLEKHFSNPSLNIIPISGEKRKYSDKRVREDLNILKQDQYSWKNAAEFILSDAEKSSEPSAVIMQHEYGLDGFEGRGTNFADFSRKMQESKRNIQPGNLINITYLHTVLRDPNEHQTKVMRDLGNYNDSLIVTAPAAMEILSNEPYGIPQEKVEVIDHGVREHNVEEKDRLEEKKKLGLEGKILPLSIGLMGPNKGVEEAIRGYSEYLYHSCDKDSRENIVYLIAGDCHPNESEEGREDYWKNVFREIESSALSYELVEGKTDKEMVGKIRTSKPSDIILARKNLGEKLFKSLYIASNIGILPYPNNEQISSGILADFLGVGRSTIATKFPYASYLLNPGFSDEKGIVGINNPHARGLCVDLVEDGDKLKASSEQIAASLHYLTDGEEGKKRRMRMESSARRKGHEMSWTNVSWDLVKHLNFLIDGKKETKGRGPTIKLNPDSKLIKIIERAN